MDTQSKKNVSRQRSQVETTTFRFENTYKTNPIKFNTEWTNYNTGVKDVDEKKLDFTLSTSGCLNRRLNKNTEQRNRTMMCI